MFIRIDQSLDEPLYQQIRNEIVRGIAQGELVPGAFIARPSSSSGKDGAGEALARELVRLAESYKASGGTRSAFEKCVSSQLDVVFGKKE